MYSLHCFSPKYYLLILAFYTATCPQLLKKPDGMVFKIMNYVWLASVQVYHTPVQVYHTTTTTTTTTTT